MGLQVLYLDVYFFINLTVDLIAIFFAARVLHIKIRIRRLIFMSCIGAAFAVLHVFIYAHKLLQFLCSLCLPLLLFILLPRDVGALRRVKFVVSFFAISLLIGGAVNYVYGLLDRYLGRLGEAFYSGGENRKALLFSLIILLTIGVLRILIMLFSAHSDVKSIRVRIRIAGECVEADAFVDSGNLVRDPMNMNPVIFVKEGFAKTFIPREVIDLLALDNLGSQYKKRIRLVPITMGGKTHIWTGVTPDTVYILDKNKSEAVAMTIVIDKEDGTYGGYDVLVPSCVISNA